MINFGPPLALSPQRLACAHERQISSLRFARRTARPARSGGAWLRVSVRIPCEVRAAGGGPRAPRGRTRGQPDAGPTSRLNWSVWLQFN